MANNRNSPRVAHESESVSEFVSRLIGGPDFPELTDSDLAKLDSWRQTHRPPLKELADAAKGRKSTAQQQREKLEQIRIYNVSLRRNRSLIGPRQTQQAAEKRDCPQPFRGGDLVFYADRVELCGVDICSGPRSRSRRIALELLSRRGQNGLLTAFSGDNLEAEARRLGAKGSAAGWIRDLRESIVESLRERANLICRQNDVILSGGSGYRFADCISVQFANEQAIKDISDTDSASNVRDVRDGKAADRQSWIMAQLQNGVQLKAPMVAEQFKRSKKTAQRDLDALREAGRIEFIGDPRTGLYRLAGPIGPKSR
jgi:hypothetical protein